jgi:phytoene desaturase
MSKPTAIVIGAGVAGLASAIRLAVQGFDVKIFEKNSYPGGKLSHFNLGDYQFDAGPSLFTQPQNIVELFQLANEPMEAYFSYEALPISFKYFYEDGTVVNAFTNEAALTKEFKEKLGEDELAVKNYLHQSADIYNDIGKIFLNHSLHKKATLQKAPIRKALAATKAKYLFKSMHQVNKASFKNAKTVQLFNRYATYNGSNPYKAPSMLCLIPHLELSEGTFYPKGGMISITNALYKLAEKKGVQFYFNSPVQRIIEKEKSVVGVVVNGENIYCNIVVSNMDVYFTYKHLLNNEYKAAKVLKQERSSSALIFYWGIKKEFKELELHNIFFSNNYKEEFISLFKTKKLYNDPTVYINITSKCERNLQAPMGKENWFVMINVPANAGQNWEAYKQQAKVNILKKLHGILKIDVASFIEEEATLDPVLIESKTASYMGSLYGTSSNSKMAAFLRHPNFTNQIKGLYFVGGSVHPGGGIPLCLQSAKIMSQLVQEDSHKKNYSH